MENQTVTVVSLVGNAWARAEDGSVRVLSAGDVLASGETLVTDSNTVIELDFGDARTVALEGAREVNLSPDLWLATATSADEGQVVDTDIQTVLDILAGDADLTQALEATAAGDADNGQGEEGGHGFVRLERIDETTQQSQNFNYGNNILQPIAEDVSDDFNVGLSSSQSLVTNEDVSVDSQVFATELLGDNLTYTVISEPRFGKLVLDPEVGSFEYVPNENYFGDDSFEVRISDGIRTEANVTEIQVLPVNDLPVAVADTVTIDEDGVAALDLLGNDTDLDQDTLSVDSINGVALTGEEQDVPVSNGVVHVAADGVTITFVPAANFNGIVDFDYTMTDGAGGFDGANVNVTVTAVNDAPVVNDDSFIVNEDESVTLNLLGNDTDVDGQTLTIESINGVELTGGEQSIEVANGTVHISAVGAVITFTPNENYNGPINFSYVVSDGIDTSNGSVEGVVTSVNDAPVTESDSFSVDEGGSVTLDLLGNDTDIEGSDLQISAINGVDLTGGAQTIEVPNGVVTIAEDGVTMVFTPGDDFNGEVSFPYTVTDGEDTSEGTVSVIVAPVDSAPIAVADDFTVPEDGTIILDLLANDTETDGDTLTITSIAGVDLTGNAQTIALPNGVIEVAEDGITISYTPNPNYFGDVNFDYEMTDGTTVDGASVSGTVTPVNDLPTVDDVTFTIEEDGSVVLDLLQNAFDEEGGTVTVTSINGVELTGGEQTIVVNNGSVVVSTDGTITFVPDANYHGEINFDYTISDGTETTTVNVSGEVSAVNDAPEAMDDTVSMLEDGVFTSTISLLENDTDLDGDAISVVAETLTTAAGGTIVIADDGSYTYTPPSNFNGTDTIQYTITDGQLTDTAELTIKVEAVNDAPEAFNDSATATEDMPFDSVLDLDANDTDLDGDSLTVMAGTFTTVQGGSIIIAEDGSYTYTPPANFNGEDSIEYTVTDGILTDVGTLTLAVEPVPDAPLVVDDEITMSEDGTVTLDLLSNDSDPDGDSLTIQSINGETLTGAAQTIVVPNGTVDIADDGTMTFTPDENANGLTSFEYTAVDATGETGSATVSITVEPVSDAPLIVDDEITMNEDETVTLDLLSNDSDPDGDSLTIQSINGETLTGAAQTIVVPNGTVDIADDGTMTFTPDENANGLTSFEYTVVDASGETGSATVSITVEPVSDTPLVVDDEITMSEDATVTLDLLSNDSDPDGDSLTIQSINGETLTGAAQTIAVPNGTVDIADDGTMTFTPDENANGLTSFEYTVVDATGETDSATVSITVEPVNDAPVAGDAEITVDEDSVFNSSVDLVANATDVDSSDLTVVPGTFNTSQGGSIVIASDGSYSYTPAENYSGTDTVDYTVTDGSLTDVGTLTINVTPIADAPQLNLDDSVMNEADEGYAAPPPVSTGLLLNFYENLNSAETHAPPLEGILEAATPTSSTRQIAGFGTPEIGPTNIDVDGSIVDIQPGDAYSVTGLIFLEAGSSYVFSGYRDDSIRIEVGGDTLRTIAENGWGDYATDSVTPTESGYYTIEMYVNNASGPGDFSLNLAVDGEPAQVLNAENFHIYSSASDLIAAGGQFSTFIPGPENSDGGYLPMMVNSGVADSYIEISNISAALQDTDGSESIDSIIIGDIPVGATLTDGANTFISSVGDTAVDVHTLGWDLSNIQILPPNGYVGEIELNVSATSIEQENNDTSTVSEALTVTVIDRGAVVGDMDEDLVNSEEVLTGTPEDDVLIGNAAVAANTLIATVETDETYWDPDAFKFEFTGSETDIYVTSITIDISADPDAYFDLSGGGHFGPKISGLSTIDSGVTYSETTGNPTVLTIFFSETSFTAGEIFQFGVDTDRLGIKDNNFDDGDDFGAGHGDATVSVSFSDGTSETLPYQTEVNHKSFANFGVGGEQAQTIIEGQGGDDWIEGTDTTSDMLSGGVGDDIIHGFGGNDALQGGSGSDIVKGGQGDDIITGGPGEDTLSGGVGADTFAWQLADVENAGSPENDTITDFNRGQGDVLDLSDLLQNEEDGNLTDFLHFEQSGADTIVHISKDGGYSSGYDSAETNQTIVLEGVDLNTLGNDADIINTLMNNAHLTVDI